MYLLLHEFAQMNRVQIHVYGLPPPQLSFPGQKASFPCNCFLFGELQINVDYD